MLLCAPGLLLPLCSHLLADSDGRLAWLIDLGAHWQWLYLPGFVVAILIATVVGRRWWCCALVLAPLPWLTSSPSASHAPAARIDLTVASANVHFASTDVGPLAAWLAREQPDVVVVLEVSAAYADGLRTLANYPYQRLAASDDPFGIALLSRHPLVGDDVLRDEYELARIEARVQLPDACVSIVAVHPMPPLSPLFHRVRNLRLNAIATEAATRAQPAIVAGDLNATPWSSAFAGLADLGLRRASDLRPSWPSIGLGLIGIPIDHVLVSHHWSVVRSTRGADLGSDHFPVVASLHLNADPVALKCP